MKFFTNTFLFLALILVAAACSPEANTNNSSDTSAQADGGNVDGSVVGSDAGDTDTASNDVVSTDKVDSDTIGQTDVGGDSDVATTDQADTAKPFCPQAGDPAEATLEIQLADGPQCFIPGSDEAVMVLAFVGAKVGIGNHPLANLMPASEPKPDGTGGCADISDPFYCFPEVKVYGKNYKPNLWEGNQISFQTNLYLVIKFPDSDPLASTEVAFKGCDGITCNLESAIIQGYYQDRVSYSIASKQTNILQCDSGTCGTPNQYKFE